MKKYILALALLLAPSQAFAAEYAGWWSWSERHSERMDAGTCYAMAFLGGIVPFTAAINDILVKTYTHTFFGLVNIQLTGRDTDSGGRIYLLRPGQSDLLIATWRLYDDSHYKYTSQLTRKTSECKVDDDGKVWRWWGDT